MMTLVVLLLLLVGLLPRAAWATTPQGELDRVLDLPGWPHDELPSKWYSGHVFAGVKTDNKQHEYELYHHYLLIESERDPPNDPVLVWSNGGPGAPSLFGLMVELGPMLITKPTNASVVNMVCNAYGWNREANLLVLNGPPPVGFSYCLPAGPAGGFKSCGSWTDAQTAHHNRIAVDNVVKLRHPRLARNEWFFSGESYAGVYIPMLVREFMQYPQTRLKIRGMAVGNACMGTDVLCFSEKDYWWWAEFMRGHAQISDAAYHKFAKLCKRDLWYGNGNSGLSVECQQQLHLMQKEAGHYYDYDVYSECWYDADFGQQQARVKRGGLGIGSGDEFCGIGSELDRWVLDAKVRRALNVPANAVYHSADNGAGFDYLYGERDLRPFYLDLIKRHPEFRTLVFSGDTDVSVNVFASQNWTSTLPGVRQKRAWRPWTLDGDRAVVGHVTEYEGDFTFATLRGSGHMAPQFKSRASFEMLQRFLRHEPLKPMKEKKKMGEVQ